MTAEQEARDLLERMEVEGAQYLSSGELVELANLIEDARRFRSMRLPDGLPTAATDTTWIEPGANVKS